MQASRKAESPDLPHAGSERMLAATCCQCNAEAFMQALKANNGNTASFAVLLIRKYCTVGRHNQKARGMKQCLNKAVTFCVTAQIFAQAQETTKDMKAQAHK
jgi:hypothetical protein